MFAMVQPFGSFSILCSKPHHVFLMSGKLCKRLLSCLFCFYFLEHSAAVFCSEGSIDLNIFVILKILNVL